MSLQFPSNPTNGQTYQPSGQPQIYTYSGGKWSVKYNAQTASNAEFARSASQAENSNYALTASYALNGGGGSTPGLQDVLNVDNNGNVMFLNGLRVHQTAEIDYVQANYFTLGNIIDANTGGIHLNSAEVNGNLVGNVTGNADTATTASYVAILGDGITVNYSEFGIELTGSGGGSTPDLQAVTSTGNITSQSILIITPGTASHWQNNNIASSSISIGEHSFSLSYNGLSIGTDVITSKQNSVAIGSGSYTSNVFKPSNSDQVYLSNINKIFYYNHNYTSNGFFVVGNKYWVYNTNPLYPDIITGLNKAYKITIVSTGYDFVDGFYIEFAPGELPSGWNLGRLYYILDEGVGGNFAQGEGVVAAGDWQHVTGKFNTQITDAGALIVGNGSDDANRSNLFVASGDKVQITGSLWVNGNEITGGGAVSASYAQTASYVTILGDGITVNYSELGIELTGSVPTTPDLQAVTTAGNTTSASVIISGSLNQGDTNQSSGNYSHAEGRDTLASGPWSHAEGFGSTAVGQWSHAEGIRTYAGTWAHAEGYEAKAYGNSSHAEGDVSTANGQGSHAEGYYTIANGGWTHTEGISTVANGEGSHAEGYQTIASGPWSHAEGYLCVASADPSHAEGLSTLAGGSYSHAEGGFTIAAGRESHTEGRSTTANGFGSHAEGASTTADGFCAHSEGSSAYALGQFSHAEGLYTVASGNGSHAEGGSAIASGAASHAEGGSTQAIGESSHAEGGYTQAIGGRSHSEGRSTIANGEESHAEGVGTTSNGDYSHAEGEETIANGLASHAAGYRTIAGGPHQNVVGSYNIESDWSGSFIIGNGIDGSNRSNLLYASGSELIVSASTGISGSLSLSSVVDYNYASDNEATLAGIPIGGVYHNNGVLRIRHT